MNILPAVLFFIIPLAFAQDYLVYEQDGKFQIDSLIDNIFETNLHPANITYYFQKPNNSSLVFKYTEADQLLKKSCGSFNPSKSIVLVIHGWKADHTSPINKLIPEAFLANSPTRSQINVIVVDWSSIANSNYVTSSSAVLEIGKYIAEFLDELSKLYQIERNQMNCIGHSLGAHICGSVGSHLNSEINQIIGLDPAVPLYSMSNTEKRLDRSDAKFVQVIHTSGGKVGFISPIGHADFYPNGGLVQPGCGADIHGICAHQRAFEYYAEAIKNGKFEGSLCDSYVAYDFDLCLFENKSLMGDFFAEKHNVGDYYLKTNSKSPYGR